MCGHPLEGERQGQLSSWASARASTALPGKAPPRISRLAAPPIVLQLSIIASEVARREWFWAHTSQRA